MERLADDDRWQEAIEESARQKRLEQMQFQKEMKTARQREIRNYLRNVTGDEEPSAAASAGSLSSGTGLSKAAVTGRNASSRLRLERCRTDTLGRPPRRSSPTLAGCEDDDLGNLELQPRRTEKFHWEPKLSKFEQNSLRRSLNNQKKAVLEGQVQKASGRIHKGPSFRINPEVISFEDFEVDQTYKQVVEITNVSLTFNTFRVAPIPEDLRDIVHVDFTPPGRMSAGTTTTFTVTFTPKKNVDINSSISILAPTGPEYFKLRCCTTKTLLRFHPPPIQASDFIAAARREESGSLVSGIKPGDDGLPAARLSSSDRQEDMCEVSEEGREEKNPQLSQVLVLDMGDLQLGAVGTSLLRVRNEGALSSPYMLYPIVLDVTNLQFPISHLSETESAVLEESQDHQPSANEGEGAGGGAGGVQQQGNAGNSISDNKKPKSPSSLDMNDPQFLTQSSSTDFHQQIDMISVDKLVMNESFSETKHKLLSDLGIADLINQWSYEPMNLQHFVIENSSAIFESKQSQAIRLSYAPSEPGDFYSILCLKMWNPLVRDRIVIVKGRCIPPPLSIESPQYDFNVCISGNHYRHKLVLHNKQKTAMKVWVSWPSTVEGELWFEPQTSYIQGQDKLTITAAFSPREEFFTRFPQYVEEFVDPEIRANHPGSLGFSIPVRIEGSDQVLPVNTILTGILTRKEIVLTPPSLDFGVCTEGSSVSVPLLLSNPSLLIMEYAFFNVHQDVSIYNALDAESYSQLSSSWSSSPFSRVRGTIFHPLDSSRSSSSSSRYFNLSCIPNHPPPPYRFMSLGGLGSPSSVPPTSKTACQDSLLLRLPHEHVDQSFSSSSSFQDTNLPRHPSSLPSPTPSFPHPPSKASAFSSSSSSSVSSSLPGDTLTHLQNGEYGYLLPGETRKVLAVYTPNKNSPDNPHFGGLKTDPSNPHIRIDHMVLRVLLGVQAAAHEVKIPWRAMPSQSCIAFKPSPILRLPVIPTDEQITVSLFMKFLPPVSTKRKKKNEKIEEEDVTGVLAFMENCQSSTSHKKKPLNEEASLTKGPPYPPLHLSSTSSSSPPSSIGEATRDNLNVTSPDRERLHTAKSSSSSCDISTSYSVKVSPSIAAQDIQTRRTSSPSMARMQEGKPTCSDSSPSPRIGETGRENRIEGGCEGTSLVHVEILPPPFELSGLTFNPVCFSLRPSTTSSSSSSLSAPAQRISVSFSPDADYMKRGERRYISAKRFQNLLAPSSDGTWAVDVEEENSQLGKGTASSSSLQGGGKSLNVSSSTTGGGGASPGVQTAEGGSSKPGSENKRLDSPSPPSSSSKDLTKHSPATGAMGKGLKSLAGGKKIGSSGGDEGIPGDKTLEETGASLEKTDTLGLGEQERRSTGTGEEAEEENEKDLCKEIRAYGGVQWLSRLETESTRDFEEGEGGGEEEEEKEAEKEKEDEQQEIATTKNPSRDGEDGKEGEGERNPGRGEGKKNERIVHYVHATWQIPLRCRLISGANKKEEVFFKFIEVSTCASPRLICATPSTLDFGDVMIGNEAHLRCTLKYIHSFSSSLHPGSKEMGFLSSSSGVEPSSLSILHSSPDGSSSPSISPAWISTQEPILLRAEELPYSSCFEVISPLRPLSPEKSLDVLVSFNPLAAQVNSYHLARDHTHLVVVLRLACRAEIEIVRGVAMNLQSYRAKLHLIGNLTRQTIELRGRGISSELIVQPVGQELDFGAIFIPSRNLLPSSFKDIAEEEKEEEQDHNTISQ
ncbi:flagellar related protein [Cystoisospora suis]|uniref:Flagellar related protein n=1 Tax=Cystoisospora suis TaxID=483139 RepID=A0A2C6L4X8_9APIC|nr:flagellar related protein [Cystoisospora suis]